MDGSDIMRVGKIYQLNYKESKTSIDYDYIGVCKLPSVECNRCHGKLYDSTRIIKIYIFSDLGTKVGYCAKCLSALRPIRIN